MKDVTTVITVCDRLEYLKDQIDAIENQTVESDIFIHWNNSEDYNLKYPAFVYKNTEKHFSLYTRFYNSLNIRTPYIFIPDDDILPGEEYLERCIEFSKQQDDKVLIGVLGMKFANGERVYNVQERIGLAHNSFPSKPVKVDMVGQGYFMHSDVLKHYATQKPLHPYGEDIHLAYTMYTNGIPIYVLNIDKNDKKTYPDLTLGQRGNDEHSQWKHSRHKVLRDFLVNSFTEQGWEFGTKSTLI